MKIGILILTYDTPIFPENLINHTKDMNIYIHPKYVDKVDTIFKKYIIKNVIETKWGECSIVEANINLLEAAYNECE